MQCIWCRQESIKIAIGHIIPEVLGYPEGFVLDKGEECVACNNGLAVLDLALADTFDLDRFLIGQPGKKGRAPKITGRPNLSGSWVMDEPVIEVNFGPGKITTFSGRILNPPNGKPTEISGHIKKDGPWGEITLQSSMSHPKLSRALHKVGLASLVKLISYEYVMQPFYDPVRKYVRNGIGSREVLHWSLPDLEYKHVVGPLHFTDGNPWIELILCGSYFLLDLSPIQVLVPKIKEHMYAQYGDKGWTWIPAPSLKPN
jgi:hypothetical protein